MLVVGLGTAIASARAGSAPPDVPPLVFLVVPFFDILLFAGFVTAAIVLRRRKEAHNRLMLLAYLAIMPAPVARLPGVLSLGPLGFFALAFVPLLLIWIGYDLVTRRRVHPAYVWGGLLLVVSAPGRLLLSGTGEWMGFAEWLVG
jgi:hypothetical protein